MAVGWTDDDAVLDQIQDTVNDEIHPVSYTHLTLPTIA